jgi:hypothetical protein
MGTAGRQRAIAATLAGGMLATALAQTGGAAGQGRFEPEDRETILLSRSVDGGLPNGPSRNASISQDRQFARLVAFESDASDIVVGDRNGVTDVFALPRRRPFSLDGEPWRARSAQLVSVSSGGSQGNGASFRPDVSGDRRHRPRCIAFLSYASNLVKGDTNRRTDAFVRDVSARRTTRVSLSGAGRQLGGTTSEVDIDGTCTRVAFVSVSGRRQVYLRDLRERTTTLISQSGGGRTGNGDSFDASIATRPRDGTAAGNAVAFASVATNLHRRDRTPTSDVYVRRIGGGLTLASTTRSGKAANWNSDQPALSDGGQYVAFRTGATDILSGDDNGHTDVARVAVGRTRSAIWVSKSQAVNRPGDGDSGRPAIGAPGTPVVFESLSTNLQGTVSGRTFADQNRTGDIFFWNIVSRNVSLQSRDSDNEIPNLQSRRASFPHPSAQNPVTSNLGNYMLFDSPWPLMDLDFARDRLPQYVDDPFLAGVHSHEIPALRQIYLRYIGRR